MQTQKTKHHTFKFDGKWILESFSYENRMFFPPKEFQTLKEVKTFCKEHNLSLVRSYDCDSE